MHISRPSATTRAGIGGTQHFFRRLAHFAALVLVGTVLARHASAQTTGYVQTNIVSDGSVPAQKTDPTLLNPWGISVDQQQLWINAAGSGVNIVEDTSGNRAFAVTIPAASSKSPHGLPSGTVFNDDSSHFVLPGSTYAYFLFCSLDGQVSGWNPNTPSAVVALDNSAKNAVYTDMALDKNSKGTYLLLANYGAGNKVEVYDDTFQPTSLAGDFTDPNLPAGYSPFGIHVIGNTVFVTYAQHDPATGREAIGAGLGVADAFDLNGNFVKQAIVNGNLNAPWGMAMAPAGFGTYANDLLVGNFGDGVINVYDPTTYSLLGQIADSSGKPLANASLWEILFVPSSAGDPNTLYFAAGLDQEQHGLLGAIKSTGPAAAGNFALASSQASLTVSSTAPASTTISVTPANGFTGTVNFACSGLPSGAACTFAPATVTVAGQAVSTTLTLSTTTSAGPINPYQVGSNQRILWPVTLAMLLPMSLLGMGRRIRQRGHLGLLLVILLLASGTTVLVGCGGNSAKPPVSTPVTPTTSQVTVTATAGALTQTTAISLTVQ